VSTDLYDIEGRLKALQEEQAETLRKFEAEAEVIRALPSATPASLKFIYTHGLDRPLYGARLGLGFKIKTLEEVPGIINVFGPASASRVEYGDRSHPYKGFWPDSFAGVEPVEGQYNELAVHKRIPLVIPAWYECEEYGDDGRTTEKVKWYHQMSLPTMGLTTFRVDCEVEQVRGGFTNVPNSEGGYRRGITASTRYPRTGSMPKGEMEGHYGHISRTSRPRAVVYWPISAEYNAVLEQRCTWAAAMREVLGLTKGEEDETGTA
jgi:hypothetical protein